GLRVHSPAFYAPAPANRTNARASDNRQNTAFRERLRRENSGFLLNALLTAGVRARSAAPREAQRGAAHGLRGAVEGVVDPQHLHEVGSCALRDDVEGVVEAVRGVAQPGLREPDHVRVAVAVGGQLDHGPGRAGHAERGLGPFDELVDVRAVDDAGHRAAGAL